MLARGAKFYSIEFLKTDLRRGYASLLWRAELRAIDSNDDQGGFWPASRGEKTHQSRTAIDLSTAKERRKEGKTELVELRNIFLWGCDALITNPQVAGPPI